MILEFIRGLGVWAWFVGGVILLGLEIVMPGNVFVWFGVAAILTGLAALFADMAWQTEFIVFGVLALVLVIVGRRFFARSRTDEPMLNRRADGLVGRIYVLSEPIVDGYGTVRVNDANWRVSGPDLPSGSRVKVTGHDGPTLIVAPAD